MSQAAKSTEICHGLLEEPMPQPKPGDFKTHQDPPSWGKYGKGSPHRSFCRCWQALPQSSSVGGRRARCTLPACASLGRDAGWRGALVTQTEHRSHRTPRSVVLYLAVFTRAHVTPCPMSERKQEARLSAVKHCYHDEVRLGKMRESSQCAAPDVQREPPRCSIRTHRHANRQIDRRRGLCPSDQIRSMGARL